MRTPESALTAPAGPTLMANAIRALAMDAVEQAKSGHPGMPMGMADAATALWTRFLKFDAADPDWPDRDRFVLSAGHGSMLLYALLHLTGVPGVTIEDLKRFRQLGSTTPGHPEYGHTPGVETTTGPLGQGLATAVGMAFAEAGLRARFGAGVVDHHTYVIAGDGCLMEGISHEAASLAGHLGLGRLIVLFDDNGISIDGPVNLSCSDDQLARFAAYGWHDRAGRRARSRGGRRRHRGRARRRGPAVAHRLPHRHRPRRPEQAGQGEHARRAPGCRRGRGRRATSWAGRTRPSSSPRRCWPPGAPSAPAAEAENAAWRERVAALPAADRAELERRLAGRLPDDWRDAAEAYRRQLAETRPTVATRKASEAALEVLTEAVPELLGGSADLTHSNNTVTKRTPPVRPRHFEGRYLHYGIREHAMAAFMNGVALHKGFVPYGGTFLVFADYCRPAIRLAALMGQRVVYVMTHDSIGLGEDGPTHQPVEHLASLRAIPNLLVFRPADALETAECWEAALENAHGPSLLSLSRQNLPAVRLEHGPDNLSARGAYVLAEAQGPRALTLLATGSEVHLALAARDRLAAEGVPTAVVSMPCWELFERQEAAYRASVLGTAPRLAVEAASPFGWTRYVASEADVIGMRGFGASAPAKALFEHFGITVEAILARAREATALPRAA